MNVSEIVRRLFIHGMVRIGRFRLTSGIESPFYIDLRRLYSYPDLAIAIADEIVARFNVRRFDAVVGVATAGIALASYVASRAGLAMGYVRSERKAHGTESIVEGELRGLRVAIIDDVATTGGSIERAYRALKSFGAEPVEAIVVVDREQGARERLGSLGIELRSLLTARQIFRELRSLGLIDEKSFREVMDYLGMWSRGSR